MQSHSRRDVGRTLLPPTDTRGQQTRSPPRSKSESAWIARGSGGGRHSQQVAATANQTGSSSITAKPSRSSQSTSKSKKRDKSLLHLKVFQASPLAYGNIPIPFLDLEEEETILKETLRQSPIHLEFEIATAHALSSFLAHSDSHFLHLSCHGHPQQLFIEDGYGGCHILVVNESLKNWIQNASHQLKFVFVSACHSRSAGNAFREAGVPYVVCCEQDGHQLLDQAARIFARGFYDAIAQGMAAIEKAFAHAKNLVEIAPEIARVQGIDPQVEAAKFVLLCRDENDSDGSANDNNSDSKEAPTTISKADQQELVPATLTPTNSSNNSNNHDADMMRKWLQSGLERQRQNQKKEEDNSNQDSNKSLLQKKRSSSFLSSPTLSRLPVPPQPFLNRELDMYRILQALFIDRRKVRLVQVSGERGMGKVSLAKALAQYMDKRNMWGPILWLPPICGGGNNSKTTKEVPHMLESVTQAVLEQYYHEKAVLMIDATKFTSEDMAALCTFLDTIFESTKYLKVIVIHRNNDSPTTTSHDGNGSMTIAPTIESQRYATGFPCCFEARFSLSPLSFEASAALFCQTCPHAKDWFGTISKLMKLHQISCSDDDDNSNNNRSVVWQVLGQGNPARILLMAKIMTKKEFQLLTKKPVVEASLDLQDFDRCLTLVQEKMDADLKRQSSSSSQQSSSSPKGRVEPMDLKRAVINELSAKQNSKNNKPPLRTQEEILDRFIPILKEENKVCRKVVPSFIRKAYKGEHISTIINGVTATENTVQDDNSWLVCGQVAGEHYPLSDEKFHKIYDTANPKEISRASSNQYDFLNRNGYREYKSKRKVWAHKVNESDMDFFRHNAPSSSSEDSSTTKEAYFMAPWGTPIRVEHGDYLVMEYPGGKDDIYRIEETLFERSYADIQQSFSDKKCPEVQVGDLRKHTLALEQRMRDYLETNPSFAALEQDIRCHLQALTTALNISQPDNETNTTEVIVGDEQGSG